MHVSTVVFFFLKLMHLFIFSLWLGIPALKDPVIMERLHTECGSGYEMILTHWLSKDILFYVLGREEFIDRQMACRKTYKCMGYISGLI